jgi:hypothetical protein
VSGAFAMFAKHGRKTDVPEDGDPQSPEGLALDAAIRRFEQSAERLWSTARRAAGVSLAAPIDVHAPETPDDDAVRVLEPRQFEADSSVHDLAPATHTTQVTPQEEEPMPDGESPEPASKPGRTVHRYRHGDRDLTAHELAHEPEAVEHRLTAEAIRSRLRNGWSVADAIGTPKDAQRGGTSRGRTYIIGGRELTTTELAFEPSAVELRLGRSTIEMRLLAGWTPEEAISTPKGTKLAALRRAKPDERAKRAARQSPAREPAPQTPATSIAEPSTAEAVREVLTSLDPVELLRRLGYPHEVIGQAPDGRRLVAL